MNILYVTRDADRWDLIAWRYYRDVTRIGMLIAANPHAPVCDVLPSGLSLSIPLIAAATVNNSGLPPWKR